MEKTYHNYEIHKDLLEFILEGKTGHLLTQPGDRKLFFENGQLVFAKSTEKGENFADILVEMGKISETQLTDLKNQLAAGESLGKALREKGFATPKDLGAALKHQIMRIITKVILAAEGNVQTNDDELPQKMPKLKISTLPLFVKNILLIESPDFPPKTSQAYLPQEAHINRTEKFESLLEESNLPDHYEPYIREFDSILLANKDPEDLDPFQYKKLVYVFHMMGMLEFEPITDLDASESIALDLGLQPDPDPFDQLGLPEDSEGLLGEEDNDLFDLADASDGESLVESKEGLDLEDFNPLEELTEDPVELPSSPDLRQEAFHEEEASLVDMTVSDTPIEELLNQQPPSPKEDEEEPPSMQELEEALDEEEFTPVLSGEFSEEFTEDDEEEDPIEALNRALEDTDEDDIDLYQDSDEEALTEETELLSDQNETVPGQPIDELTDAYKENLEDLSDGPTIPGEFTASDLEQTQKLSVLETEPLEALSFDTANNEEDELPPFEPEPEQEPGPVQLDESFILPEPEDDNLHYFEKKRTWPLVVIPAAIIVLGIFGYLFRDRIPFLNNSTSDISISEPLQDTSSTALEEKTDKTITPDNASATELNHEEPLPQDTQPMEQPLLASDQTAVVSEQTPVPIEKENPKKQQVNSTVKEPAVVSEAVNSNPKPQTKNLGQSLEEVIAGSREVFVSSGNRFTLVFMVACLRETVEKALVNHPNQHFYIIQRPSDGKICYCLSWGEFVTRKEARNASSNVPGGFLGPGEKPWILKVN